MKKTEVLHLPGEKEHQSVPQTPAQMRAHLETVRDHRSQESPVMQAAHVGRAAMHLLHRRLYASYTVSQAITRQPNERALHDPAIKHEFGIHETTVPGEPARVSLVGTKRFPGVEPHTQVISVPQHEDAALEFNRTHSGLFVMDRTARSFAWDEPERYEQQLAHSAGVLLDLMHEVEVVELPEPAQIQKRLAA
jgi:hypothetical protein